MGERQPWIGVAFRGVILFALVFLGGNFFLVLCLQVGGVMAFLALSAARDVRREPKLLTKNNIVIDRRCYEAIRIVRDLSGNTSPDEVLDVRLNKASVRAYALALPVSWFGMRFLRPHEYKRDRLFGDWRSRTITMAASVYIVSAAAVYKYMGDSPALSMFGVWRLFLLVAIPSLLIFSNTRSSNVSAVEFRRAWHQCVTKISVDVLLVATVWCVCRVPAHRHVPQLSGADVLLTAIGAEKSPVGVTHPLFWVAAGLSLIVLVDLLVFGVRKRGYRRSPTESLWNCLAALLARDWPKADLLFEEGGSFPTEVTSADYYWPCHFGVTVLRQRYAAAFDAAKTLSGLEVGQAVDGRGLKGIIDVMACWFALFSLDVRQREMFGRWFVQFDRDRCSLSAVYAGLMFDVHEREDYLSFLAEDLNTELRRLAVFWRGQVNRREVGQFILHRKCVNELILGSLLQRRFMSLFARESSEERWVCWAVTSLTADDDCGGVCCGTLAFLCSWMWNVGIPGKAPTVKGTFGDLCWDLLSRKGWIEVQRAAARGEGGPEELVRLGIDCRFALKMWD